MDAELRQYFGDMQCIKAVNGLELTIICMVTSSFSPMMIEMDLGIVIEIRISILMEIVDAATTRIFFKISFQVFQKILQKLEKFLKNSEKY